jgi:hypothetical protein
LGCEFLFKGADACSGGGGLIGGLLDVERQELRDGL